LPPDGFIRDPMAEIDFVLCARSAETEIQFEKRGIPIGQRIHPVYAGRSDQEGAPLP
jgi:hypothetical protein